MQIYKGNCGSRGSSYGIIKALENSVADNADKQENYIVCCDNMDSDDFQKLDFEKLAGIVLKKGSLSSFIVIMAKIRHIPLIVGCEIDDFSSIEGKPGVINAGSGLLYVNPDSNIIKEFGHSKDGTGRFHHASMLWSGLEGNESKFFANAACLEDVKKAVECGARGIGLFRSEFLFLGRESAPTEEEQVAIYEHVLLKMGEYPVVVRTADFGPHKHPSYVKPIDNLSGIQFSLIEEKLLHTQLRALLRASLEGNLNIMFPMVSNVTELKGAKSFVHKVMAELMDEEADFRRHIRMGVMVENAEALKNIEELAENADFFSIGTNDLAKYVLGINREDNSLSDFDGENKDKLLEIVKNVIEVAHSHNIKVNISGELASVPSWMKEFIELGADALSVSL